MEFHQASSSNGWLPFPSPLHKLIFGRSSSTKHSRPHNAIVFSAAGKKTQLLEQVYRNEKPHLAYLQTSSPGGRNKIAFNVSEDLKVMCEQGQLPEAVDYFELVHQGGLRAVYDNYEFLLQECAKRKALEEGKKVHTLLTNSEVKLDIFLVNNILSMYAKCGSIVEARQVFDAMRKRDVVSWTVMINAYGQNGNLEEALRLLNQMVKRNLKPNKITFICMLKACNCPATLKEGKEIHDHITKRNLETNIFVGIALVDMYVKCGSIKSARKVFNKIPSRRKDALWNLMIASYVENGQPEEAMKVFQQMQREKVEPNDVTFVNVLKACSNVAALEQGKQCHACIRESKFHSDVSVVSSLVEMYISCGSLLDARHVFDQMPVRASVTWTSMITAYVQCGNTEEASRLSYQMQQEGVEPFEAHSEPF